MMPRLILPERKIIFMASGPQKIAILEKILHGQYEPKHLPAQLILSINHPSIELLTCCT